MLMATLEEFVAKKDVEEKVTADSTSADASLQFPEQDAHCVHNVDTSDQARYAKKSKAATAIGMLVTLASVVAVVSTIFKRK